MHRHQRVIHFNQAFRLHSKRSINIAITWSIWFECRTTCKTHTATKNKFSTKSFVLYDEIAFWSKMKDEIRIIFESNFEYFFETRKCAYSKWKIRVSKSRMHVSKWKMRVLIVYIKQNFTTFFCALQISNSLSNGWTDEMLIILYKNKEEQNDLKNYKFLFIMNTNYKLFTKILMQRLVIALNEIIDKHQFVFLFKRLIDDNIKIIQSFVTKFDDSSTKKLTIIFLNQKKIYDKINHIFLRKILKKLKIFTKYIRWIMLLYKNVKIRIMINDHMNQILKILSNVKQNDFLNCSLFIAMIECLTTYINQCSDIQKIKIDNEILKLIMYVDDTTIFVRNQVEIDKLMKILKFYDKVIGAKINWNKTKILFLNNVFNIQISMIKSITRKNFYSHLNISIDTHLNMTLNKFWQNIFQKTKKIRNTWFRFHMSMREKIMITNFCIMFRIKYAIKFLEMFKNIRKAINTKYYSLIWNNKRLKTIFDFHVCCFVNEKDVNAHDLRFIIENSIIFIIIKSLIRSKFFWIKFWKNILIQHVKTNQMNIIISTLINFWMQRYINQ